MNYRMYCNVLGQKWVEKELFLNSNEKKQEGDKADPVLGETQKC